jgi:hypothetical protein
MTKNPTELSPVNTQADDTLEQIAACPAYIACGGPHGVMPFGNVLIIPAINQFLGNLLLGFTFCLHCHKVSWIASPVLLSAKKF